MAEIHTPAAQSNKGLIESIIVVGVGVVLAAGAAVTLTTLGMFAAILWFH